MINLQPERSFRVDQLQVQVYPGRRELGMAAGADVIDYIQQLLNNQERVRIVFAAAPSQNEFLEVLASAEGIDWSRIIAFHMDEYIGLPDGAPQSFSCFLRKQLFERVKPGVVHLIAGDIQSVEQECQRYGALLASAPIDIIFLGIGENGHIAFNDPPVADFTDLHAMKAVELDEACRTQQVNDGCFVNLDDVPTHALTLTIPTLMSGTRLFCIVPGATKRSAVQNTLQDPISTACPASILRKHPNCTLYVDCDSFDSLRYTSK